MSLRSVLISFFLCFSNILIAQEAIPYKEFDNKIRLNYMVIKMPNKLARFKKPEMGLGGMHYQLPLNDFINISGGMYYALLGDQGGLFTLGVALGVNKKIYKNIYFDGNIHVGGGGGYRELINDGSYINGNIGLEYKKNNYAIGVQYSYLDFVSGDVRDNTISFYLQIPSKIHSTSYKEANRLVLFDELEAKFNKKASKSAMLVRFDFFDPIRKSRKDIGTTLRNRLYLLGFEYQKYLNSNMFVYVHTDAIYKGLRAGFMDLFIGVAYHPVITKYINVTTKLGFGSAGGRVFPEGGLTVYPSIGLDLKPHKNITIASHLGYFRALDGGLEAKTCGVSLKYNIVSGGTKYFDDNKQIKKFTTQGFRVSLESQSYIALPKTDDLVGDLIANLQLVGVNLAYDFNNYFYSFGEAGFAYKERSGGYAHGLIGLGLASPKFFKGKIRVYLDIAGGVAGGGGIDTKEGVVLRGTLGLNYDINDCFSMKISGGRFVSYDRTINVANYNLGISYNIAFLKPKE